MTQEPVHLSKSQYLKGKQCPLSLFYALYRRDLTPQTDSAREAVFKVGRELGDWAKKCFPGGVEITAPYYNAPEGAAETKALIAAGHKAIFEATAIHPEDGSHARADILQKIEGANAWHIIEVKGSSDDKDYHLDDLAFQYRVFTAAGYRIHKCALMHVNNQYIRQGDIDPQALFVIKDMTDETLRKQTEVEQLVSSLRKLEASQEPKVRIGGHCAKPFACDYTGHCWRGVPDHSIFDVLSGRKAEEMIESLGSYEIKSLPAGAVPTGRKKADVWSHVNKEVYIEPDNLRSFLEDVQYPLYFLDYETVRHPVPLFDDSMPFQQIPFQFSLHIEEEQGAELRHHAFLHRERSDPRPAFIEALIESCGNQGTVLVYNQVFEEGVNKHLAALNPARSAEIRAINDRMIDLYKPFQKRWLYHPSQNGSASIKKVLPAFTDLSYHGMNISSGDDASQKYLDFIKGALSEEEAAALWQDLYKYCELDTYAMKVLLGVLYKVAA